MPPIAFLMQAPLTQPDIEAVHTDLPTAVTPPTIEEIKVVIKQNKSGKVAASDNIPPDALRSERSNCKYAPYSDREDLGITVNADRLERRTPRQNNREWRSEQI
ncbi:unnamed protein product [Schistosoma curassoni]|uniref:Uncharacterized protein n=1 Tax=Schistosoma curassoni TaxID=6186 RepID=A0A183KBV8_9TREM|nr:unnamed protein product [Schistosoma curassoni]